MNEDRLAQRPENHQYRDSGSKVVSKGTSEDTKFDAKGVVDEEPPRSTEGPGKTEVGKGGEISPK